MSCASPLSLINRMTPTIPHSAGFKGRPDSGRMVVEGHLLVGRTAVDIVACAISVAAMPAWQRVFMCGGSLVNAASRYGRGMVQPRRVRTPGPWYRSKCSIEGGGGILTPNSTTIILDLIAGMSWWLLLYI
jgi:hypothetical protein